MTVLMTAARLKERGDSLWAFERLGGWTWLLIRLDRQVREGRRSDWVGRPPRVPEHRHGPPPVWLRDRREDG